MTAPKQFYGLLTVRLSNPPSTDAEAIEQIGKALGIAAPVLDEQLGILHGAGGLQPQSGEKHYVVGVESGKLREYMDNPGTHPNVVGVRHAMAYTSDNKPVHLKSPVTSVPQAKKPKGP